MNEQHLDVDDLPPQCHRCGFPPVSEESEEALLEDDLPEGLVADSLGMYWCLDCQHRGLFIEEGKRRNFPSVHAPPDETDQDLHIVGVGVLAWVGVAMYADDRHIWHILSVLSDGIARGMKKGIIAFLEWHTSEGWLSKEHAEHIRQVYEQALESVLSSRDIA